MVLGEGSGDYYNPVTNNIGIDKKTAKDKNIFNSVAAALHEGGHAHDKQILGYDLPKELMIGDNAKAQLNKQNVYDAVLMARRGGLPDPTPEMLNEIASKGHHARIPNLRDADSFGTGALKSMLKSGTFKGIAHTLPVAGTALALASGDANAAMEEAPGDIPGVGQVYDAVRSEPAGSAEDDKQMIAERNASANYNKSPARLDALKKLGGGY
jgi:hypothetical protein